MDGLAFFSFGTAALLVECGLVHAPMSRHGSRSGSNGSARSKSSVQACGAGALHGWPETIGDERLRGQTCG
jgi:hypothetical protein